MAADGQLDMEMEDLGRKAVKVLPPTNQEEKEPLIRSDSSEEDAITTATRGSSPPPLCSPNQVSTTSKRGGQGFVVLLTLVAALGGFLFGYDTGVVSGAIIKMRETFLLSSTWLEVVVSVTIAAAAVSALLAGFLCDFIGRRPTLLVASVVFTVGSLVLGAAYHLAMLVIGRVIVGVGIGIAAMAVPMYIAESAPARLRGMLVVLNVLFLTGGQLAATVVDGAFSFLRYDIGWRFMLGLGGVPSVLMFIGLLFMPESPRWLVFRGKTEKARAVLGKLRRHQHEVETELESIFKDFKQHKQSKLGD